MESTGLDAESSFIVGFGLMSLYGRFSHSFAKGTVAEGEARIIRALLRRLRPYDTVVTWYGAGFDFPLLISRALKADLDPSSLLEKRHIDLWRYAKSLLKLQHYDLDNVCKFFGVPKRVELKGYDMPPLYMRALTHDKDAMKLILEHCRDDLEGLRQVFLKMRRVVEASGVNSMLSTQPQRRNSD
ncbi:MAG: ribonuclease H-like domain-containing protein [Candidatus Bathyarchaeia archaeon]